MLLGRLGIVREVVDPGGRLLVLADGTNIRLTAQCTSCDAATIRAVLAVKEPLVP